ncbi:hypothetical protein ILYODFUR_016303 [Ilyodon furcidens]|uniref:Uncharacterized protein n=1 Tax=Ilyodon furcidens TaxID=33524 RepID=A0ABV0UVA5_9TELE
MGDEIVNTSKCDPKSSDDRKLKMKRDFTFQPKPGGTYKQTSTVVVYRKKSHILSQNDSSNRMQTLQ